MDKESRQRGQECWAEHVNLWKKSGLSQSAYCRFHGLVLGTFNGWVVRLRDASSEPQVPATLVPVVIKTVEHAQLSCPLSLQHPSGWQLQMPAGTEANWLGKVLRGLS